MVAALLAAPLVLGMLPAGAQAAPDPRLTITEVKLDRTSVAVSGLNTYPINVTVKGGYHSDGPGDANPVLDVILDRTSGTGPLKQLVSTDLKLTSGTVENGFWSGRLNVASTADGSFQVTGVFVGPWNVPNYGTPVDPTPYRGQTVLVKGTNLPRITASLNPRVIPFGKPYAITWAVTNTATGKPYGSRIPIGLGVDAPCADGGLQPFRTGTNGIIVKSYTATDAGALNCAGILADPYLITARALFAARPSVFTATPARTSAPVGTVVNVNGTFANMIGSVPIQLQRLYGRTQWRTVSSAWVRQSGRFTLTAQPSYKGLIPYRVYFAGYQPYVPAIGKTFTIKGV